MFRAGRWSLTSGFGHFQSRTRPDRDGGYRVAVPAVHASVGRTQFSDDPRQTNVYVYSSIDLPEQITLTLGASADFYNSRLFERKQFNPKGRRDVESDPVDADPRGGTRTLHRALVSSQTIEPTQVSGFNQFFADAEGEEAVRYGIALDQKVGSHLFADARDVMAQLDGAQSSFGTEAGTVVERFDRKEQLGRAYLYWAPRDERLRKRRVRLRTVRPRRGGQWRREHPRTANAPRPSGDAVFFRKGLVRERDRHLYRPEGDFRQSRVRVAARTDSGSSTRPSATGCRGGTADSHSRSGICSTRSSAFRTRTPATRWSSPAGWRCSRLLLVCD